MKIETIPTINLLPAEQPASAGIEGQAGLSGDAFSGLLDQAVAALGGFVVTLEESPRAGEAPPARESPPDGDRDRAGQVGFGLLIATSPAIAPEIVVPDLPILANADGSAAGSPETQSGETIPDRVPQAADADMETAPDPGSALLPVLAPVGPLLGEGQRPASSPGAMRSPDIETADCSPDPSLVSGSAPLPVLTPAGLRPGAASDKGQQPPLSPGAVRLPDVEAGDCSPSPGPVSLQDQIEPSLQAPGALPANVRRLAHEVPGCDLRAHADSALGFRYSPEGSNSESEMTPATGATAALQSGGSTGSGVPSCRGYSPGSAAGRLHEPAWEVASQPEESVSDSGSVPAAPSQDQAGDTAVESDKSPGASKTVFQVQTSDCLVPTFAAPAATPASDDSSTDQVQVSQDTAPAAQPAPRHAAEPEINRTERVVLPIDPVPFAAPGSERSSQSFVSALLIAELQRYAAAVGRMDPVPAVDSRLECERDSSRIAAAEKPSLIPVAERQPAFESSEPDWLQDNQLMLLRAALATAEAPAEANQGAAGLTHSLSEPERRFATDLALASARALSSVSFDPEPLPALHSQGRIGAVAPSPVSGTAEARTVSNLFGEKTAASRPQAEIAFAESDFLLRVAEQMHLQVREGRNLIRIQLRPSALGRVEIRAESGDSGMAATILTESLGVKNYVEQNLHLLYRSLQDLGLKIDRILVLEESWAHHPGGHHSYQETRSGQDGHDSPRPYSWPGRDAEVLGESFSAGSPLPAALAPYSTFHVVA